MAFEVGDIITDFKKYEEVKMEWFLSQEPRSIRELSKKYFDSDLEKAWNFIENYDNRSVDEYDAEDYDEVAVENAYVDDEDDEDYQNEKAKRLEKTKKNKVILVNAIYDTPADKGGLGLSYNGLDAESRQLLYKLLGGKKKRKTNKRGGSKSKKSPKKDQIEKQIFNDAKNGNITSLNKILQDKSVDINWANPKEKGNTPLHVAAENGRHEIVELLLKNGASVDKVNNDGQTPLMMSILNYYRDTTAEVLIEHGADINKMDNTGKNSLHMACKKYGAPSIVKLLIKNGANVNEPEKNVFANTPLHLAAMNKSDIAYFDKNKGNEANKEIATILLAAGADPELKNAKGDTVMELAESSRNHWIVEILKNFAEKKLHFMSLKRQWLHGRLSKATIGVLLTKKRENELTRKRENELTRKRENELTRLSNVLIIPDLNREIKSYLGGKKRSSKYQKAGRKTRKSVK